MKALKVLKKQPRLFYRLSGIRLSDFEQLVLEVKPLWEAHNLRRLSREDRKRAIGAGRRYRLGFEEMLLLCLIYYRTYINHEFLGLIFGVSDSTSIRATNTISKLLAGHFNMPERKVRLSEEEKQDLLYLIIDGTERPVQRPKTAKDRKRHYSGKKKRHTHVHQIVTDNRGRILACGPAQQGRKHDKKIYDDSQLEKPPDTLVLGDLAYQGTSCEVPIKKSKNRPLSRKDKSYNRWFNSMRITAEHAIGRMKKFNIFSDISRGNRHENMIAKNIAGLANMNLKIC